MVPLEHAAWRKSSRSEGQTQCVEVADLHGHTAVRDSKNPTGPALVFTTRQISGMLHAIKTGRLDG